MKALLVVALLFPTVALADQSLVPFVGNKWGIIDRNTYGHIRTDIELSQNFGGSISYELMPGLRLGGGYSMSSDTITLYPAGIPMRDAGAGMFPKLFVEYQRKHFVIRIEKQSYDLDFYRGVKIGNIWYTDSITRHYDDTWIWLGWEWHYE